MGASARVSFEWALMARMLAQSRSSHRAIGTPCWIVSITQVTASRTLGNWQVAADTDSGWGCRRRVSSVTMPSVPSEPTKSRVRS